MLYLEKWDIKKKGGGGKGGSNINSAFFNTWLCNGDVTWLKDILNYFENSENTEIIPYGICDSLLNHSFSSEAAAIDMLPETAGKIQNMHLFISVTGGVSQLHHIQSNFLPPSRCPWPHRSLTHSSDFFPSHFLLWAHYHCEIAPRSAHFSHLWQLLELLYFKVQST